MLLHNFLLFNYKQKHHFEKQLSQKYLKEHAKEKIRLNFYTGAFRIYSNCSDSNNY